MAIRLLHFADAHIDMANYGRHDPQTGLPLRVLDFLRSLDEIVDAAISEKVDLVIFAGDAYKDRAPAPTFQREWGRRIMRLSQARIPTLLLIGNHDVSPAAGRAHAIQEFDTLQVPFVRVLAKPEFLGPAELWDLPIQVIAIPWISRSGLLAQLNLDTAEPSAIRENMLSRVLESVEGSDDIRGWLEEANPSLPIVLTAHASVENAKYGSERTVMLGNDLVLSGSLVRNPQFSYVALGHIHKPQDLNEGHQPPAVYPGSIERIDFGEAEEARFFVLANIEKGRDTQVEWRRLQHVRPMIDRSIRLEDDRNVTAQLLAALPPPMEMKGAILRLTISYPRDLEKLLDEAALRNHAAGAFEFHIIKRPRVDARARLSAEVAVASLSPLELLDAYWSVTNPDGEADPALNKLAAEIIREDQI